MTITFADKVYAVVKKIPRGSVMTYAGVAKKAGKPGAARAVGTLMARNADKRVPCHRIIRSDGKIGDYNGLQGKSKRTLLQSEWQ